MRTPSETITSIWLSTSGYISGTFTPKGRLVAASGWIASGPGLVSRSLLDAVHETLGLPVGNPPVPQSDPIRYEQLKVSFAVDSTALKLQGRCHTPAGDAIMMGLSGPLLGPSPPSSHSIASVIEVLLPGQPVQVSATRETEQLMSRLPLPSSKTPVKR